MLKTHVRVNNCDLRSITYMYTSFIF